MRSKEDIWIESREFLLKEYDACWAALTDTYNRNESWFKFHITFLTLAGGIVGVTSRVGVTIEYGWQALLVFLCLPYLVGLGTLGVLYKNRGIIVEYINAINAIRRLFVLRATENVEPNFHIHVLLPVRVHRHFKKCCVNYVLIYIVLLFNLLTSIGLLWVFYTKVYWIIRFGYNSALSHVVFALTMISVLAVPTLLVLIALKHRKRDKEVMKKHSNDKALQVQAKTAS